MRSEALRGNLDASCAMRLVNYFILVAPSCLRSYNTRIRMTSWWAWWRLKSPASRLFTQPFIQGADQRNIKALRHWPLCGEFTGTRGTGDRWFPRTKGQYRGNVSIWWRHHGYIMKKSLTNVLTVHKSVKEWWKQFQIYLKANSGAYWRHH